MVRDPHHHLHSEISCPNSHTFPEYVILSYPISPTPMVTKKKEKVYVQN